MTRNRICKGRTAEEQRAFDAAYAKRWREKNREHLSAYRKRFREKHKEEIKAEKHDYYVKNRDVILAKAKTKCLTSETNPQLVVCDITNWKPNDYVNQLLMKRNCYLAK